VKLSREEQIAELKSMESGLLLHWARPVLIGLSVGLLLMGYFTGIFVYYIIAIVLGVAVLIVGQITPHISNAVRGMSEGKKQNGSVMVSIKQWLVEGSDHESYHGLISMDNQPLWQMEFVQPQWQPVEGVYQAELVFICGVDWPVVILTSDGLLYPRYKPQKTGSKIQ
jgi:hypothetical protein